MKFERISQYNAQMGNEKCLNNLELCIKHRFLLEVKTEL